MMWAPHEVQTLIARRRSGDTFQAIADDLGRSRSACIGKLFRMAIACPAKPVPAKPVVERKTPGLGGPAWSRPQ